MIVLYPGSFDPPTLGHMDIIDRASKLFDKVYVAVMVNINKSGLFPQEQRFEMLKECVCAYENVVPLSDGGLLSELTKRTCADAILRGLRGVPDYLAESSTAEAFFELMGIETVFLASDPKYGYVSSSLIREMLSFGEPIEKLVPKPVLEMAMRAFKKGGS